jgi:hypothetical protein
MNRNRIIHGSNTYTPGADLADSDGNSNCYQETCAVGQDRIGIDADT